jgi:hypothetical protein
MIPWPLGLPWSHFILELGTAILVPLGSWFRRDMSCLVPLLISDIRMRSPIALLTRPPAAAENARAR